MNSSNIDISKIIKYMLMAAAIVFVIILNYCSINEHMSSNSRKITAYKIPEDYKERTRPAVVAGIFYPAEKTPDNSVKKRPELLIIPHAGYKYSTAVAAKAYQALKPYASKIKNVIFVVPQHKKQLKGAAIYAGEKVSISGKVYKINEKISEELSRQKGFSFSSQAFASEEIMSEQLPLLQQVVPNFLLVPLVYGDIAAADLAAALEKYAAAPDTLIIISSDLANYYSELQNPLSKGEEEHSDCGNIGIEAAQEIAKNQNLTPEMLDLVNAQDIMAQLKRYDEENKTEEKRLEKERQSLKEFKSLYGKDLLKIARISLEEKILHDKEYRPSRKDYNNTIFDKGASYVKLQQNGQNIGQSGTLLPKKAIAHNVAHNTYEAVENNDEHTKITPENLPEIKITIALLTGYERVRYNDEQDLLNKLDETQDGVILRSGDRQAAFLPEEWKNYKSKQEFLNALKFKAGLSPSYWSNKIKIFKFYTEEITEDEN